MTLCEPCVVRLLPDKDSVQSEHQLSSVHSHSFLYHEESESGPRPKIKASDVFSKTFQSVCVFLSKKQLRSDLCGFWPQTELLSFPSIQQQQCFSGQRRSRRTTVVFPLAAVHLFPNFTATLLSCSSNSQRPNLHMDFLFDPTLTQRCPGF